MSDYDYKVEKEPFPVKLYLSNGTMQEGIIFRGLHAAFHEGPEMVKDVLWQTEQFIPVHFTEGATRLIHKDQISAIAFQSDDLDMDPSDMNTSSVHEVTVQLVNNIRLEGNFLFLLPSHARRVKDFLNQREPFLELRKGKQVYLINKAHVLFVEEK